MSDDKQVASSSGNPDLAVVKDYKGQVVFAGESAGYQNSIGTYTYDSKGVISNVKILFANASAEGAGGNLVAGKSAVDVAFNAGDKVGFFIIPNGFGANGNALNDKAGSFQFVDAKGNPGNVNGGVELKLVHVDGKGQSVDVKSAFGTSVFHTIDDGTKGLNGDKTNHVVTKIDVEKGTVSFGFEDLKGGGDKDFNDLGITVKLGQDNVKSIASPAPEAARAIGSELLVDGSFESAVVGANTWTHQGVVGGWRSDTEVEVWGKDFYGLKATDGNKIAELDYDAGGKLSNIYQDVKTEAGAQYTFEFDFAKRPDSKAGSDTINVFWNGQLIGTVDPANSTWAHAAFNVSGTGGTDRIEFRESAGDNDGYGGLLDNASLKKSGPSTVERVAAEQAAAEKAAAEKAAAEQAAAEKAAAEQAAAEKAAAEQAAAEKAAAEQAAAEKAAAEQAAAEKAAAEQAAAEKAAAEQAAAEKAAAEQAAAEKAAAEQAAAEKAAAEKAAAEQAAAEKAAAEQAAAEKAAAEQAAAEKAAADALANQDHLGLRTIDVVKIVTSDVLVGTKTGEGLTGGEGNDHITGKSGNDTLVGDVGGKVTAALDIAVSLVDLDNSRTVALTVSNVPLGAALSAGTQNSDGSWTLSLTDLQGLTITANDSTNFSLHVVATATDASGNVLTEAGDINVVLDNGNQDLIEGGRGNDNIAGGAGNDVIYGGSAPVAGAVPHVATYADNDVLFGNDGNDVIYGNSGDDRLSGDAGNDTLLGGKGNDQVSGGDGNDVVNGNSGDDVITGDAGSDTINGGSGFDTLDYSGASQGLAVDLTAHTATGQGNDTLSSIEKVIGSSFDDAFIGDSHDNEFEGGAGNDRISGSKGNDVLTGGAGNDVFSFTKSDVFNFKEQKGWVDHVTDFQVGDKLDLSGFFKAGTNIDGLVKATDDANGTTISVKFGGEFHDVVVLDGVHGHTANDLLKDGSLFVA